jgi:hypothetical protein
LAFENTSLEKNADSLPFVQRILNSNYSDRVKISAAQLHFGNIVNLDRGIFLRLDERPSSSKPLSNHMSDMLAMQNSLLEASAKERLRTDLLHLSSMEQAIHNEYESKSYLLVHYRTGAPRTRLRIFGDVQFVSGKDSR